MAEDWSPSSWRIKPIAQDVKYTDKQHLARVTDQIKHLPPLVTPAEIERLRYHLSRVESGQGFILHAGDCAESFEACTHRNITNKIGLILSFSLVLLWGARVPIVRIGRIAGQYAKPRSSSTEVVDGKTVLSFRGDNVNGISPDDREPDPQRMLSAYFYSTTTLNYVRALLTSDFASLHHPRTWSLKHVRSPTLKCEFENITNALSDALAFTQTVGAIGGVDEGGYVQGGGRGVLGEVDFYSSHEGLMLDFEEAMTRFLPIPAGTLSHTDAKKPLPPKTYYNTSAHFLWIGDRTRQLTHAHVEYFRGIRNPIGIKVGPSMKDDELARLLDIVNPDKEHGKVTLITRYGAGKVETHLPGHIAAIRACGHPVIWVCDPMHGNTHTSSTGYKTRHFSSIITEVTSTLALHAKENSRLGGVSLEFTGELNEQGFSVTECLGGSMQLGEEELELRYQSYCDPRLNFEQALDLAFLLSDHYKQARENTIKPQPTTNLLLQELGKTVNGHAANK
ncbi:DAHP synthetase [Dacryopinax primogenitus]|uniref:Phospho-2-dehydro-3-deoxyheptonate aldolase n=1 Tax=Dacryopinax primogenitus (strain DJM 731) TaxID=1858805 RepID=M5FPX4_DACPD|nr:DAHP synthetase [Dacryopinax primogenitus]EJT98840.1 DAHP synthetase [Dacryopinax primogenitus]